MKSMSQQGLHYRYGMVKIFLQAVENSPCATVTSIGKVEDAQKTVKSGCFRVIWTGAVAAEQVRCSKRMSTSCGLKTKFVCAMSCVPTVCLSSMFER